MRRADERGSVTVSSLVGVTVLLLFLLLSTQTLVHLHATSTVSAVAFDVARRASAADSGCPDDAAVRSRLGGWGADPAVRISCVRADGGATTVVIEGPSPAAAFGRVAEAMGFAGTDGLHVRRAASFRTEVAP